MSSHQGRVSAILPGLRLVLLPAARPEAPPSNSQLLGLLAWKPHTLGTPWHKLSASCRVAQKRLGEGPTYLALAVFGRARTSSS
eukprot:1161464-Pelagomonas_calceolata.AAC.8